MKIGKGAYIADRARVITKDVPDDAMAERSPQNNRDGRAKRYRETKSRAKAERERSVLGFRIENFET